MSDESGERQIEDIEIVDIHATGTTGGREKIYFIVETEGGDGHAFGPVGALCLKPHAGQVIPPDIGLGNVQGLQRLPIDLQDGIKLRAVNSSPVTPFRHAVRPPCCRVGVTC